jgi:hypothetical protein
MNYPNLKLELSPFAEEAIESYKKELEAHGKADWPRFKISEVIYNPLYEEYVATLEPVDE